MKKLLLLLMVCSTIFCACDLFNANLIDYLEYYSTTAGIDHYNLDNNYPTINNIQHISADPAGSTRKIQFIMRNPQRFDLNFAIDWQTEPLGVGVPVVLNTHYTVEQVSYDTMELTLLDPFLQEIDTDPALGEVSATISPSTNDGRVFDAYYFTVMVNSAPAPVENEKLYIAANKWIIAFNLPSIQDKDKDIHSLSIGSASQAIDASGGSIDTASFSGSFTANRPDGLESLDGSALPAAGTIYYETGVSITSAVNFSIGLEDNKGLRTSVSLGNGAEQARTRYYVNANATTTGSGTSASSPYQTIAEAIEAIENGGDASAVYVIHIQGTITEKMGDNGTAVIDTDKSYNITLQGWDSDTEGEISGVASGAEARRALYIAGANVTIGTGITISGGSANLGGGIFVESGNLSMTGGTISGNKATVNGGGVYLNNGTFTMTGGIIGGTAEADRNTANIDGGGVFINHGTSVLLDGGTISGNKASLTHGCSGGAMYVEDGATLTMKKGNISGNEADNGGAIAVNGDGKYNGSVPTAKRATFTMSGGTINGNTVLHEDDGVSKGGAVYLYGSLASFTMNEGTIIDNDATAYASNSAHGGGVYVGDKATFTMIGGTIQNNSATTKAGGIYVKGGDNYATFNLRGSPIVKENTLTGGGESNVHYTVEAGGSTHGKVNVVGSLGSLAEIYIIPHETVVNTLVASGNSHSVSVDDAKKFKSDTAEVVFIAKGGNLEVGPSEHYYVSDSGASDTTGDGTELKPYASVQKAVNAIVTNSPDPATAYTIHIDGEITDTGTSGANGMVEIVSNAEVNITLQGLNSSNNGTINAAGKGKRVLYINGAGANITLGNNLTLTGGDDNIGGGVYVGVDATLHIAGTTTSITGNEADEGGGLYIHGTLTMEAGTISGNSATSGGGVVANGPFSMTGGTIGGDNPTDKNSATVHGGGVYVANGNTFTMSNTAAIKRNTATTNGGGVFIEGIFNMKGGTIGGSTTDLANTANEGGGVFLASGSFTMEGGTISENTATKADGGGGGVYVSNGRFTMSGSGTTITKNDAGWGAGVAMFTGGIFDMNGGVISKNEASVHAGGVYLNGGTFNMNAGEIHSNSALHNAGGVLVGLVGYNHGATFNMSGGSIQHNKTDWQHGGGVYVEDTGTLNISKAPVIKNNGVGGIIESDGTLTATRLSNVFFANAFSGSVNTSQLKITAPLTGSVDDIGLSPATNSGGAIVVIGNGHLNTTNAGIFTSDTDDVEFELQNGNLIIKDVTRSIYISNIAGGSGDGLSAANPMAVTTEDQFKAAKTKFTYGTGTMWVVGMLEFIGGATLEADSADDTDDIIVKRYESHKGALINVSSGDLTLKNITLDGGAIKNGETFTGYTANSALITISGSKLTLETGATLENNNNTSGNGGAINASGGTIEMKAGSQIKNNKADGDGGGVYTSGTATFKMDGGTVLGNISYHGGGVYIAAVDDADSDGTADEMFTFSGGIIGGTTADAANVATKGDGGGLYLNTSKAKISSTAKVIGNEAKYGGGVYLYNTGAKLTMNGGAIGESTAGSANTATMEGGGIFLRDYTELSMTAGTIVGNTADANGGGIYSQGNIEITGDSARIEQNTGNSGGGVYVYSGTFTMSNGTITQNNRRDEPTYAGGGVYLDHGNRGSFKLSGNPQITGNGIKDDTSGIKDNVSFDNKDGNTTPLSLAAGLDNIARIGLNPVVKDPDALLVTGGGYSFTTDNFPMDNTAIIAKKDSNDLRVNYTKLNAVFLDGDEGVNTRSGADSASAVKTFAKALELLQDTDTATIWITKTVQVTTSETWDGQANSRTHKAVVKRNDASISGSGSDFDGYLINVTGSSTNLILQNITIDGQGGITADFDVDGDTELGAGNISATASLVHVNGGNFKLNSNATLQNNKNTTNGGGVYITSGILTLDGGKVTGNKSLAPDNLLNGGGGIYVIGGSFTLNSGYIHDNSAAGSGGGVALTSGSFTFESGGFITGNSADAGGGISVRGATSLTIGGSIEISENNASHGAGINFASDNTSTLTIKGGKIYKNISDAYGGGVHFGSGKNFTMSNGSIYENEAKYGGGVFVREGLFKITGGSITKNDNTELYLGTHGGGVYLLNGATLELSGTPIIDNNTFNKNIDSNVYFANEADSSPVTVAGDLIPDTSVTPNIAPSIGLNPKDTIVGYMLVKNNAAYGFEENYFTMDDGKTGKTIDGNDLKVFGNASEIYLDGTNGNNDHVGNLSSAPVKTFAAAVSRLRDGGIIWVMGTITVNTSSQVWETPTTWTSGNVLTLKRYYNPSNISNDYFNGRLINITNTGGLTLKNIIIDGQQDVLVASHGSNISTNLLINVDRGTLNLLEGSILQNNYNNYHGGALTVYGYSKFLLDGGVIRNNKSGEYGGGIFFDRLNEYNSGFATLRSGSIENNSSAFGGGIYAYSSIEFRIEGNISINNNSATKDGGGVYLSAGNIIMEGGSITNNSAVNGGGIFLNLYSSNADRFSAVTFKAGEISSNTASDQGGGVLVKRGNVFTVSAENESHVTNNTANGSESNIYRE